MSGSKRLGVAHVSLARGYRGCERQIELLIKELSHLGVPQALVCRDDSPLPFHLDGVKGLKVIRIRGFSDPRFSGHFRVGSTYNVVHAHDPQGIQWALVHYILRGTRYVVTVRDEDYLVNHFMLKAAYKSASSVVCVSKEFTEVLSQFLQKEVQLISDCSSRLEPNEKLVSNFRKSLANRFVVGNVAPLINRQKGQSVLIDAAKILKNKIPELLVVFVGAGDEIVLLRRHAKDMPNVKFIGFKRNYVDYIKAFDVFAYPANTESSAGILLDVMEQGVPIVASNVGGIPDLIEDGKNGFLIEAGDAESLADYILTLKKDRELYYSFVSNGHNEAELHSSAAMAAEYYRNYFSIIHS